MYPASNQKRGVPLLGRREAPADWWCFSSFPDALVAPGTDASGVAPAAVLSPRPFRLVSRAQFGQVAIVRSFRSARILPALLAPPLLFESVPLVLRHSLQSAAVVLLLRRRTLAAG